MRDPLSGPGEESFLRRNRPAKSSWMSTTRPLGRGSCNLSTETAASDTAIASVAWPVRLVDPDLRQARLESRSVLDGAGVNRRTTRAPTPGAGDGNAVAIAGRVSTVTASAGIHVR